LSEALRAEVDLIEADIWHHGGDVHVRHEHRLGRLPLLVDRRSASMPVIGPWALPLPRSYFLRPELKPFGLSDLLSAVDGQKGLLIDVKGSQRTDARAFAHALIREIERRDAVGRTMFCGFWPVLDVIRREAPRLEVRYTVETPRRVQSYLKRLSEGRAASGICAYYRLLDSQAMLQLGERAVDVFAWTVDDAAEAEALVGRGVSGITSNDLGLLARIGPQPPT
jgi:glycerophosphoryl diester phosphodiesterase